MGILNKLLSAVRGGATEIGESIVENNQITILKQEVRDAESELKKATETLSEVMADEVMSAKKVKALREQVARMTAQAEEAVAKGAEDLALEVFSRVETLESELSDAQAIHERLANSAKSLEEQISNKKRLLTQINSRVSTMATQDKLNKVTVKMNSSLGSSSSQIAGMTDSLTKVQENLDRVQAKNDAKQALSDKATGADLEQRLKAQGIGNTSTSAQERLAQAKAKMAAKS